MLDLFVADKKDYPVLVLDAGHGGFDPGAIGGAGTLEKDVSLAIALKVQELFEKSGTMNTNILNILKILKRITTQSCISVCQADFLVLAKTLSTQPKTLKTFSWLTAKVCLLA